jgi:hypothetical protein
VRLTNERVGVFLAWRSVQHLVLKIEMGFSANASWTYDESNDQIFWFDNCLKTCQK